MTKYRRMISPTPAISWYWRSVAARSRRRAPMLGLAGRLTGRSLGCRARRRSAQPAGAGVLRGLDLVDETLAGRALVDGVDAGARLLDHLGNVLEADIVALEGDLDVLDLVVDLDERDVDAVDALEVAELVGEHEHRGLVRLEHETPDLAHVVITLRSRVAG